MSSLFGQSLSFPPRVGPDGGFVWSQGEDNIRESIAVILKTDPNERVGVPDFGAGFTLFLFELNEAATHARLKDAIVRSLNRWEERIQVENIDVVVDPSDSESALATITYRLVATQAVERINVNIPLGRT